MKNLKKYLEKYHGVIDVEVIVRNISNLLQDNEGLATVTAYQPSCVFVDYSINDTIEKYVIINADYATTISLVPLNSLKTILKFKHIDLLEGNVYVSRRFPFSNIKFIVHRIKANTHFEIIEKGIGYPVVSLPDNVLRTLPSFDFMEIEEGHSYFIVVPDFLSVHQIKWQAGDVINAPSTGENIFMDLTYTAVSRHSPLSVNYGKFYPLTESGFIGNYGTMRLCLSDTTPKQFMRVRYRIVNNTITIFYKRKKNILKQYRERIKDNITVHSPLLRNQYKNVKIVFAKSKTYFNIST